MNLRLIVMVIFIFWGTLAAEVKELTFHELNKIASNSIESNESTALKETFAEYHLQHVRVRGFLYKVENGAWILAAKPNLKSCCVGSKAEMTQQIVVSHVINEKETTQVVLLDGIFKVDPQYNHQGNLQQLYSIEEAVIITEAANSLWRVIIGGFLLVAFIYTLVKFKNRYGNKQTRHLPPG